MNEYARRGGVAESSTGKERSAPQPAPGKRTLTERLPMRSGGGQPIPSGVRDQMEQSFGADFSTVRIHEGAQADAMGAIAYTQGDDIHFSPGSYDPASSQGRELLGHELTHVVQQRAGRVSVPQGKGAPINADDGLEREADELGARAAR